MMPTDMRHNDDRLAMADQVTCVCIMIFSIAPAQVGSLPYLPTCHNPLRHCIDKKPIGQAVFFGIRDENAKDALAVRAA